MAEYSVYGRLIVKRDIQLINQQILFADYIKSPEFPILR